MYTQNYLSSYTFIEFMWHEYLYEYLYLGILKIIRMDIWVVAHIFSVCVTYNYTCNYTQLFIQIYE